MSRRLLGSVLAAAVLTAPAAPALAAPSTTSAATVATAPAPKPPVKKAPVTKTPPKKTPATKTPSKKTPPKKSPARPAASSVLKPGSKGSAVLALQKRLTSLGYWMGTPNGYYGHATSQAVMAVQKAAGLGRDGVVGPATRAAIDKGVRPTARTKSGKAVEIDLRRQLIVLADGGKVRTVLNTSTGTPATPTPPGSYRVQWGWTNGWKTSPLGKLYRPKFFYRGYAVHGVADGGIPGRPASHGCARVSTVAMDMLWKSPWLTNGAKVVVY